jgi:hypothetical protein
VLQVLQVEEWVLQVEELVLQVPVQGQEQMERQERLHFVQ